jgi:GAF domain
VLHTISHRAFELIPAAEHAAISRGRNGRFETVAATSDIPPRVDEIQYDLGSGPCVDAVVAESVYLVGDLVHANRWPEFGRQAAERYGIRSMLSTRMYLEEPDDLRVGLNLYSSRPNAFDESDRTTAILLATHGGLALAATRRQHKIDNLQRALLTNRRIGTAIGVLMATYKARRVVHRYARRVIRSSAFAHRPPSVRPAPHRQPSSPPQTGRHRALGQASGRE